MTPTPAHSSHSTTSQLVRWRWPALLVLGVAVSLSFTGAGETRELRAFGGARGLDADSDGLTDVQENILGTWPNDPDSDRDGFSDLEEIARRSDPMSRFSVPESTPKSVGLYARQHGAWVTVGWAVYSAAPLKTVRFNQGLVISGVPIPTPNSTSLATSFLLLPVSTSGASVVAMEVTFPASVVRNNGILSLYAVVSESTDPLKPISADVMNLIDMGGVITEVERSGAGVPAPSKSMQTSGGNASGGGTAPQGGLIYSPLVGDDDVPPKFSAGQICFQLTSPIGINGASVVQEIESAGCQPAESYCSPSDCSSSIGGTVEVVDPALLIGG